MKQYCYYSIYKILSDGILLYMFSQHCNILQNILSLLISFIYSFLHSFIHSFNLFISIKTSLKINKITKP